MINIKSTREIELMKEAGKVVSLVFTELRKFCKPGVSTLQVSEKADEIIRAHGCTPTFLNYGGFSGAICVSVNDTLIHGIPSKDIILKDGDIVTVDVGATYKGYDCDAARTFPVGNCKQNALDLIKSTEDSFFYALEGIKEGSYLGDICSRIEEFNKKNGYTLTHEYCGHGTGRNLHEDPEIPNYGTYGTGPMLRSGMTLAIEPMVNEGKSKLKVMSDGWTTKTKDGKLSSHYENTVLITKSGYEILTLEEGERSE